MIPIITIDGPSGSGKGTIGDLLARRLGWHWLDSGALYRVVGLAAQRRGLELDAADELASMASELGVEFRNGRAYLDGEDVSEPIRAETAGKAASRIAVHAAVRERLLVLQRASARPPGLVADGRDMGTLIFPEADLKIFLTASAEERARRRYKQLIEKELDVSLLEVTAEIRERDERDSNRSVAPLKVPAGALTVDTTSMTIPEVLDRISERVSNLFPALVDRSRRRRDPDRDRRNVRSH
jgi:cytidylate kinase